MSASDFEPGSGEGTVPEEPPPSPTEPPPTTPEPPPEAPGPGDTITWEPATWYSITFACLTEDCTIQNIVSTQPNFYSNNGKPAYIRVNCSVCHHDCKILTAAKLDPQPEEE
jgi:hypothetical protein